MSDRSVLQNQPGTQEVFQAKVAVSKTKDSLDYERKHPLMTEFNRLNEQTETQWNIAKQLGITEETLKQHHPELDAKMEQVVKSGLQNLKKGALATVLSGLATMTIAIAAMYNKSRPAKWIKGVIALGSGGVGSSAAAYISAHTFGKASLEDVVEYKRMENTALSQEITKAMEAQHELPKNESAPASVVLTITPRNASFAAQTEQETKHADQLQALTK